VNQANDLAIGRKAEGAGGGFGASEDGAVGHPDDDDMIREVAEGESRGIAGEQAL